MKQHKERLLNPPESSHGGPGAERRIALPKVTVPKNIDLPDWEVKLLENPGAIQGLIYTRDGRLMK
jgi:hypothetical protein